MPITWRVSRPWLAALAAVLILSLSIFAPLRAWAQVSDDDLAKVRAVESARIAAIDKVYHSVVAIYGMNRQGGGSGVIFDPDGYALTNFHVTSGAGVTGWAGLADGKLYKWHLVGHDPGGDVAIIKLEGPTPDHQFHHAELADSDSVRVGDFAMAMGNPFILAEDQKPTVTLGIVSGVKRYQAGTGPGGKMLEYGNCIQIDSSINPGNSGGPLFNMQGQVIGINGRGSFEERGRVNVGLGYAISINQCKLFIPELLATKTCEHGTLDAVFARRGDNEVICESINLDSALAKVGFELGDRLLKLDGQPIRTTNEFTSLIATLPAHWPVEVVWEHDGKVKSGWVRLSAITYPKPPARPQPQAKPAPKPVPEKKDDNKKDEKKEEKKEDKSKAQGEDDATPQAAEEESIEPIEPPKPDAPKSDAPKPDAPKPDAPKPDAPKPQPAPKPIQIPQPPQNAMEFGKIRDAKMNEREALRVIEKYQTFMGGRETIEAVQFTRSITEIQNPNHKVIGIMKAQIATDGRARVDQKSVVGEDGQGKPTFGKETTVIWDASRVWRRDADGKVTTIEGDPAKLDPDVAKFELHRALLSPKPMQHFKRIVLEGTDKSQDDLAYRILIEDKAGNRMLVWFSVLGRPGYGLPPNRFETRLIKFAFADDKGQAIEPAITFGSYGSVAKAQVSHASKEVTGLDEKVSRQFRTNSAELMRIVPPGVFDIPE